MTGGLFARQQIALELGCPHHAVLQSVRVEAWEDRIPSSSRRFEQRRFEQKSERASGSKQRISSAVATYRISDLDHE